MDTNEPERRKGTIPRGPTSDRVADNVREARGKMSLSELADACTELGRPTLPTAIHKIERHTRQISVDDLVTLALALGVTPNRLLLTEKADGTRVELTPATSVHALEAWRWVSGEWPLDESGRDPLYLAHFRRTNRPHDPNEPVWPHEWQGNREAFQAFATAFSAALRAGYSPTAPAIWLSATAPTRLNDLTGPTVTAPLHLTAENAWKLAEQLMTLVANHYQGDARPEHRVADLKETPDA